MPFKAGKFAMRTQVPISQTRMELEKLLQKYGADSFGYAQDGPRVVIGFRFEKRTLRFMIPMPVEAGPARARWRALLLCIRAKLESVACGIESFDEAFMPHVVMPDGKTVGQYAIPAITQALTEGKMPPLLTFRE